MIPTLLVLGLLLGAFVHDRTSASRVSAAVLVFAIAWGIVIGIADDDLSTAVGGAAVGLANLAAGSLAAAALRSLARRIIAPTTAS